VTPVILAADSAVGHDLVGGSVYKGLDLTQMLAAEPAVVECGTSMTLRQLLALGLETSRSHCSFPIVLAPGSLMNSSRRCWRSFQSHGCSLWTERGRRRDDED